ncbi:hypothetical protein L7F22_007396 [Adiantum nelumboides]|nr:hypothetical protein [Adiantum nelumboides]
MGEATGEDEEVALLQLLLEESAIGDGNESHHQNALRQEENLGGPGVDVRRVEALGLEVDAGDGEALRVKGRKVGGAGEVNGHAEGLVGVARLAEQRADEVDALHRTCRLADEPVDDCGRDAGDDAIDFLLVVDFESDLEDLVGKRGVGGSKLGNAGILGVEGGDCEGGVVSVGVELEVGEATGEDEEVTLLQLLLEESVIGGGNESHHQNAPRQEEHLGGPGVDVRRVEALGLEVNADDGEALRVKGGKAGGAGKEHLRREEEKEGRKILERLRREEEGEERKILEHCGRDAGDDAVDFLLVVDPESDLEDLVGKRGVGGSELGNAGVLGVEGGDCEGGVVSVGVELEVGEATGEDEEVALLQLLLEESVIGGGNESDHQNALRQEEHLGGPGVDVRRVQALGLEVDAGDGEALRVKGGKVGGAGEVNGHAEGLVGVARLAEQRADEVDALHRTCRLADEPVDGDLRVVYVGYAEVLQRVLVCCLHVSEAVYYY